MFLYALYGSKNLSLKNLHYQLNQQHERGDRQMSDHRL